MHFLCGVEKNNLILGQLPKEKAADFILECYEMAGVHVRRGGIIADNLTENILKHHGTIFVGYLLELFNAYANEKTKYFAQIRPSASSFFINKLKKAHQLSKHGETPSAKKNREAIGNLTGAEKLMNFLRFCDMYQILPANPDWIAMANTLCKDKRISTPGQRAATYAQRLKVAKEGVMQYLQQYKPRVYALEEAVGTAGAGNLNIAGALKRIKN